jgi:AcrR family transcriptional regulator
MRADAVRNRTTLLQAARVVFQRDGLSAQMDVIADTAGLGVGTLYRHFPTKEALLAVLVEEHLDRLIAGAEAAAEAEDAWEAVTRLVWAFASFEAEDRGMLDILSQSAAQPAGAQAAITALMDRLETVVARAQSAGKMRSDVSAQDVLVAVCGVGKMTALASPDDAQRWERLIEVFLDGLRAPARLCGGSTPGGIREAIYQSGCTDL